MRDFGTASQAFRMVKMQEAETERSVRAAPNADSDTAFGLFVQPRLNGRRGYPLCHLRLPGRTVQPWLNDKPKTVIRPLCANELSFLHLLKNRSCYHPNANDRFGLKTGWERTANLDGAELQGQWRSHDGKKTISVE